VHTSPQKILLHGTRDSVVVSGTVIQAGRWLFPFTITSLVLFSVYLIIPLGCTQFLTEIVTSNLPAG
jgi:uncharacterized membrane protein